MAVEISDNHEERRFEAYVDGELAGIAEYHLGPGRITFLHTEVKIEGQGVGSALVQGALDAVRADGGLRVRPKCPFFRSWIEEHPDYQDLVD
jgi:predicted GNAT family acetyltransferase